MRILALLTDCFGGYGGIAQSNRDLVTAFSVSPDISEIVVLPRLGKSDALEIPEKIIHLMPVSNRLTYALSALKLIYQNGPFDMVFCGHIYITPLALLVAKTANLPIWLHLHGIEAWDKPSNLKKLSLERCDLITSVSRYTRSRVLQWANIDPNRLKVLPNTYRLPRKRSEIIDIQCDIDKPFILTVARINREDNYKGHRRVLDIFGEVRKRHPDLQYVIAGDGSDRNALEAYAASVGVADAVHFLGYVPDERLPYLMASARAFVMPSTREGFGIVFQEAASYGIPVIGGNKDGSVDALADGAIGTLVNPTNARELCDAILAAVEGRALLPDPKKLDLFCWHRFQSHVNALLKLI